MNRFREGFKARLAAVMVMAAVALGLLQVAPVSADTTNITFAIAAGGLAMDNVETDVTLTSTNSALGTTAAGSLGNITVTDTRNLTVGWVVSGTTSDFVHTVTPANKILAAQATMTQAATAIEKSSNLTFAGGVANGATGGVLATGVVVPLSLVGSNSATFAPTISIVAPASTPTGTYNGVFTSTIV